MSKYVAQGPLAELAKQLKLEGELGLEIWRLARPIGVLVISVIVLCGWFLGVNRAWDEIGYAINSNWIAMVMLIACIAGFIQISIYTANSVRAAKTELAAHLRTNLVDGKLLEIVLAPKAVEIIPDLQGPSTRPLLERPIFGSPVPSLITAEDRIAALIDNYRQCCKRFELQPFPRGQFDCGEPFAPFLIGSKQWLVYWYVGFHIAKMAVLASRNSLDEHHDPSVDFVKNVLQIVIADILEQAANPPKEAQLK